MKKILYVILTLFLFTGIAFATITNTIQPPKQYTANGLTTNFPITFDYIDESDLTVTFINDLDGSQEDWVQDALGDEGYTIINFEVVANTAPDDGTLTIDGLTSLTQELDLKNNRATPAELYESALDKATLQSRDNRALLSRTPIAPAIIDPGFDYTLPNPTVNNVIGWNSLLDGFKNFSAGSVSVPTIDWIGNYDDLASAVAAIGSSPTILQIPVLTIIADGVTVTTPSTLTLWITQGGKIDGVAGGGPEILNINGPLIAGDYQIFGENLVVEGLKKSIPYWFGANNNETLIDDTIAINSAVASLIIGGNLHISGGLAQYKISSPILIDKSLFITGDGEVSEIRQVTSNTTGLDITASNVTVENIKVSGLQNASFFNSENAIHAHGADSSNYLSTVHVRNCIIDNFGGRAIWYQFVQDYEVVNNFISNINYAGFSDWCGQRGSVHKNNIFNMTGEFHASYGITITRHIDTLGVYPRSSDINVTKNIINTFPWTAIDFRSTNRSSIEGNIIKGGQRAINVATSTDGAAATFEPIDTLIKGNNADSGSTAGTTEMGIRLVGYASGLATGSIEGNFLRGYNDEDSSSSAGILIQYTKGIDLSTNQIIECGTYGILLFNDNYGFGVRGNVITDPWTDSKGAAFASAIGTLITGGVNNIGFIGGNSFVRGGKTATNVLTRGITIDSNAGNSVEVGINYSEAATYIVDTGDLTQRGVQGSVSTSGTGEDILRTTTIKAGTVGVGQTIKVTIAGDITNSNGNKTIIFHFGSYTFSIHPANNDTNEWSAQVTIQRNSSSQQRITCIGFNATAIRQQSSAQGTEDMTADVLMKVTGECADGADLITQKVWDININ